MNVSEFLSSPVRPLLSRMTSLRAAVFMLLHMFGAVMAIRAGIEWPLYNRRPYLTRFKSFVYGDTIGFPLFGFLAARLLQNYEAKDRWFDLRGLHFGFGTLWGGIGILNYLNGIRLGDTEEWRIHAPSEWYHTLMYGVTGGIISHAVLSVFLGTKHRLRDKIIAVAPLSIWIWGVYEDGKQHGTQK